MTESGRGAGDAAPSTDPVSAYWDAVLDDMAATAAEFEDRGWRTLTLRPGDVTPVADGDGDRYGFDVLLPDDEFAELLAVVDGASFEASDVYATVAEGTTFLLVTMRDDGAETAVLFPLYYARGDDSVADLKSRAEETGTVSTRLRRLEYDRVVTFEHDEPALFFPDGE